MQRQRIVSLLLLLLAALAIPVALLRASDGEVPVKRVYAATASAPLTQTAAQVADKSSGCYSCHVQTDEPSMHATPAVMLGCVDCHGGDAAVRGDPNLGFDDPAYVKAREAAHVLPLYPKSWNYPSSATPQRTYTLLNRESPEFIRFINPSDYRVVRESCGACHQDVIDASERSLMSTGAMLWGGAAYNNGIVPYKNYLFGEAYTRDGKAAKIVSPGSPGMAPGKLAEKEKARGALEALYPMPTWHVIPPGDIFRVFERGGRIVSTQFAEVGLPNSSGSIQRLDEPGRPDLKQSNRGPATGLRVAIPVLNIHKTRLNDPFMWFAGTSDQPGDYRHSGCSGCHVIYANNRENYASLGYSQFGRDGQTATVDPTIKDKLQPTGDPHGGDKHGALKQPGGHEAHDRDGPVKEKGHPIRHAFTRAIPTAQCMTCHMHQPNIFLNTYLGYTMWDYESDAPLMWPEKQKYPTIKETHAILDRNPEAAAVRGKWGDVDFLRHVFDDVNPKAKDTQFADYHGHGWNFRGIFKRDRNGNLLDADGNMATYGTDKAHIIANDDPEKFRKAGTPEFPDVGTQKGKAVHMMDIHAEKGLQCADCHFSQDSHGNGFLYGEVANAIEIGCKDCHGTADALPTLLTSGPAARPQGNNLALLRNMDGQRRFEWVTGADGRRKLLQRSIIDPKLVWEVSLVKDAVDPTSSHFNIKAARAKLMSKTGAEDGKFAFGTGVPLSDRAHPEGEMACFTCHLSWSTSCGGCHLPIEANFKTKVQHFEGEETRNFATYNPQVARDDMFQLGKHMTTKGNQVAPIRSTSALVLSSTNVNRERIYIQQPPISGIGFSSQAFAPHFPHTVRKQETKTCTDCHLSERDDNNAIMAQLLLLGTNYVNFVGLNAWTGLEGGFQATRVTEWDEPQAVIGSYLQKWAYPDYYKLHVEKNGRELKNWVRGRVFDKKLSGERNAIEDFRNIVQGTPDRVGCLQMRGEYMFVAQGKGGFHVYDIASVANKGFSERITTAPFSPLGQDAEVRTTNATCMAIATDQPINPLRNTEALRKVNQEQAFKPIYSYAAITDSVEGLVLVNIETFADGEFRNNFIKRAVTWNPDNVLKGARHIVLAGEIAYITADAGLVVVNLSDPLNPRLAAIRPLSNARASAVQFRYLWVTDADGLKLFDITKLENPVAVPSATVALADARHIYLARTYAYVAAKSQGLAIIDITRPEHPTVYRLETLGGQMNDVEDVIVGSTNASLFAYVADGRNGMKVLQLTSPDSQPNFYGFSPPPMPELIAWARTPSPALSLSKGLDRDRAVDETGGQIAVFGRLGSRPFTRPEMERLFLTSSGVPFKVSDTGSMASWVGPAGATGVAH